MSDQPPPRFPKKPVTPPTPPPAAPVDPDAPPVIRTRELIDEALKKQAASRPPRGKPNIMPVTPMLPRVPKPYKRKKPRQ